MNLRQEWMNFIYMHFSYSFFNLRQPFPGRHAKTKQNKKQKNGFRQVVCYSRYKLFSQRAIRRHKSDVVKIDHICYNGYNGYNGSVISIFTVSDRILLILLPSSHEKLAKRVGNN